LSCGRYRQQEKSGLFHFKFKPLNTKEKCIVLREESTEIHEIELTKTAFSGVVFEAGEENLAESSVGVGSRRIVTGINNNSRDTDGIKLSFFSDRNLLLNNVCSAQFCFNEDFIHNSI
jgi:hypothetical protein